MTTELKKTCRECPFKRNSLPGYLGASNPVEFIRLAETQAKMPCHMPVNYDDPNWRELYDQAPQCRGRAEYMSNRCKVIPGLVDADDNPEVFTWPQEFLDHHSQFHEVKPKISMIIGNNILIEGEENG